MTQIVPVSRTSTTNRGSQKVNVWLKTKERMNLVANGDFIVSGEDGLLPNISDLLQMAKQTIVITAARPGSVVAPSLIITHLPVPAVPGTSPPPSSHCMSSSPTPNTG